MIRSRLPRLHGALMQLYVVLVWQLVSGVLFPRWRPYYQTLMPPPTSVFAELAELARDGSLAKNVAASLHDRGCALPAQLRARDRGHDHHRRARVPDGPGHAVAGAAAHAVAGRTEGGGVSADTLAVRTLTKIFPTGNGAVVKALDSI